MTENVIHTRTNVLYLPQPNKVEAIISNRLAPNELTPTAFVLPILADGSLLMANHARRGLEIPGGHRNPGEHPTNTAIREALEETGCKFGFLGTLGYLKNTIEGDMPEGYEYPYPVSYQQFFVGEAISFDDYVENEETLTPVELAPDEIEGHVEPYVFAFYIEAMKFMRENGIIDQ